jgi:hypothetical protein
MRLNMKKTEIIQLGPFKNRYMSKTLYDMKITNDLKLVRCLGIYMYIGDDTE